MNVSKTREAVWAAAFVSVIPPGFERWQRRPEEERLQIEKECSARADLAVELFELAVAPAGDATVKELSELRADSDENADAADKAYQRAEKAESDLAALREKLATMRTFRQAARETADALGKQLETAREELKKERIDSDVTLGKFRAALTVAEQERDALREAGKSLLRAVYVGDGKVVCPNAIIGPVREMTAALSPAPDSEEG